MLRRRSSAAALVALAGLATLGAGPAPADWSAPQQLSERPARDTPTLAFDATGAALATWATADRPGRRSASRSATAVAFRTDRDAPAIGEEVVEGLAPEPVVDDRGGVVAIAQRKVRPACGLATIFTLTPRFGRVSGTFAPAQRVWTVYSHTEPPAVALAGNHRGLTLVAWMELLRDSRGRCVNRELVRVAVRRPGGSFGTPVTLARSASAGAIAAAVGADGRMLVAWRRGSTLQTRTRSARGRWAPAQSLSVGVVDSFAATLAANGAATLLWTRTTPATTPEDARVVGAATRGARSSRFVASTLERATWPDTLLDRPERRAVRLAPTGTGALAAWTSWAGDHLQVVTARAANGRFAAARTATPAGLDVSLGDLAVGAGGRAGLAMFADASTLARGPRVALAAADGVFGAPETVGGGDEGVNGMALAFSPRTGRPTVVWTQARTVRTATRSSSASP